MPFYNILETVCDGRQGLVQPSIQAYIAANWQYNVAFVFTNVIKCDAENEQNRQKSGTTSNR